jgi:hypothetical protein
MKRIFTALNAEPTKPKKDIVISPQEAHAFVRARYEALDPTAIRQAITFLNSEPGIKQRELSKEFSQLVPQLLSGTASIDSASSEKAKRVEDFFTAAGVLEALKAIPYSPDPTSKDRVLKHAIDFYASKLSNEELAALVAHYSSENGQAAVAAALSLSKEILNEYGI